MTEPYTRLGTTPARTTGKPFDILVVGGDKSVKRVADTIQSLDEQFHVTKMVVGAVEDADVVTFDGEAGFVCGATLDSEQRSAVLSTLDERDRWDPPVFVVGERMENSAFSAHRDVVTEFIPMEQFDRDPTLAHRIRTRIQSYRELQALADARKKQSAILEILHETVSRGEVGTAFCEFLVDEYDCHCAWLRTTQRGTFAKQWTAGETGYVEEMLEAGVDNTEPIVTAFRTDERVTVAPLDAAAGGWQSTAVEHGFGSAVGVPVHHEGAVLGALSVYCSEMSVSPAAREFLSRLARTIGYALRTAAWREAVLSAVPIAVEIELTDDAIPLLDSLREVPEETELATLAAIPRNETVLYVLQLRKGTATEALSGISNSAEQTALLTEQPPRFEATFERPTPETILSTRDGQLLDVSVRPEKVVLTVAVRSEQRIAGLLEAFEAEYDNASVGAVWSRGTEEPTDYGDVAASLTARQRQVLEFAYLNGYFDQPRGHNMTEIADKLNLSRQTVSQHLRAAERKLVQNLLEPAP